jgi:hypothetical protein
MARWQEFKTRTKPSSSTQSTFITHRHQRCWSAHKYTDLTGCIRRLTCIVKETPRRCLSTKSNASSKLVLKQNKTNQRILSGMSCIRYSLGCEILLIKLRAFRGLHQNTTTPSITLTTHLRADFKNEWLCNSTPPCAFLACTGTNLPYVSLPCPVPSLPPPQNLRAQTY